MSSHEMIRHSLVQGDCFVTADPFVQYSTVLGSCIAVCMFEPNAMVGGMNHFLLPDSTGSTMGDTKYGVYAMEILINGLLKLGADRFKLEAKVFGGSRISVSTHQIGQKNQDFARDFLKREGIPCVAENLGGSYARKIQFIPTTGKVRHLLISAKESPKEETVKPVIQDMGPSITLF